MWKYNKSFSFKAKSSYHSQALDVSAEGLSDPFAGKAQPILMKKKALMAPPELTFICLTPAAAIFL